MCRWLKKRQAKGNDIAIALPFPAFEPRKTICEAFMAKEKGILVRFTTQDHEQILKKAEQFNVSVSVFLNRLGLEKEIPTADEVETFLQIIYQLDRIGNNLNQISKHLSASRKHGWSASITEKEILTAALEARNLHSSLKNQVLKKWQS
jgi:hypothetical protein